MMHWLIPNLGAVCVLGASCFYVAGAIGFSLQGHHWTALAYFCWAVANGAVMMATR